MEKVLFSTGKAAVILLSVLFLGNLVPTAIATFIAIMSNETFEGIITSCVPYWIGTVIGWLIAAFYINDELKEE